MIQSTKWLLSTAECASKLPLSCCAKALRYKNRTGILAALTVKVTTWNKNRAETTNFFIKGTSWISQTFPQVWQQRNNYHASCRLLYEKRRALFLVIIHWWKHIKYKYHYTFLLIIILKMLMNTLWSHFAHPTKWTKRPAGLGSSYNLYNQLVLSCWNQFYWLFINK